MMKVTLEAHTGRSMASGDMQTFEQYRIVVDGTLVGYKSWVFGKKICFIGRVSPLDRELIEEEVNDILGDQAGSVQPPEYDPSDSDLEEEEHFNDLDEETAT